MTELKPGMFAKSLAGHDKGKWYIVLEAGEQETILTDGKNRPVERPKKKNRRHIRPCCEDSGIDVQRITQPAETNAAIRKAIKIREDKECQKQM